MNVKERLIQGLSEAGCSQETAERISTLYETGSYDEMHESQRKVDRMDFLIRHQEKQMKARIILY